MLPIESPDRVRISMHSSSDADTRIFSLTAKPLSPYLLTSYRGVRCVIFGTLHDNRKPNYARFTQNLFDCVIGRASLMGLSG